ncbi:MAG: hypothetical protein EPO20_13050 [Betaproteobacteria bacterium]|nr:MAG: hypothetical protein EPO20_13050 [Betaproteobacteria bacterium]
MRSLVVAVMLSWSALLPAAELSQPHILVAKPALRGPLFASSVVVIKPTGGDQRKPEGLWEELVRRSAVRKDAI